MAAGGQRRAAIEDADVIEAEKAALEHVYAFGVFSVYPPGEIEQEFLENALEKSTVAFAASLLFNFVDAPRSPGVNRRIHITEAPIRTRATVRSDACTIRAGIEQVAPWRNRDRPTPAGRSEKRDPTRRTRGIPTCQAWKSRRRCKCAASRCCGRACAVRGALVALDRRRANRVARSDRTAWTTAVQRRPDAERCGRLPTKRLRHYFSVELIGFFLALHEDAVKFAVEAVLLRSKAFLREAQSDRYATT